MATMKGLFLMNLSIVGAILALAVYQVPQPWRGILVAWLLFLTPAGMFALRLLRHHYECKKLRIEQDQKGHQGLAKGKKGRKRRPPDIDDKLKVVHAEGGDGGRYTI